MTDRRFPPPWKVRTTDGGHFEIRDAEDRPTGVFVYVADEGAGIDSAVDRGFPDRDAARKIANCIARLPELLQAEKYHRAKS